MVWKKTIVAELQSCNFCKTILMLLVIAYHSILFWGNNWFTKNPAFEAPVLKYLAQWLNSFHIYGFTLISGYIFYYTKHERESNDSAWTIIKKKTKRLLIPYVFISCLWVIPLHCIFFETNLKDIVEKYVFAQNPSQLWFVVMLFLVFVLAIAFERVWEKGFVSGLISVVAMYAVGIVGSSLIPNIFQIWSACQYLVFFWLGYVLRERGSVLLYKFHPLWWLVIDIVMFMSLYFIPGEGIIWKLIYMGMNLSVHIVGALMSFVVLQNIALTTGGEQIVDITSRYSMTIYLLHQQIIYIVIYFMNGKVNPYVHALLNFVIAFGVSYAIAIVLHKFRITRFLIGEK